MVGFGPLKVSGSEVYKKNHYFSHVSQLAISLIEEDLHEERCKKISFSANTDVVQLDSE